MTLQEAFDSLADLRPSKAVSFLTDEDILPIPNSWISAKKTVERIKYEAMQRDEWLVYVTPSRVIEKVKYGPWMVQWADMVISTWDDQELKVLKCRFGDNLRDEILQTYRERIAV